MKKRFMAVLCACVMTLCACGGSDEKTIGGDNSNNANKQEKSEDKKVDDNNSKSQVTAKGYTFTYNDYEIVIDSKIEDVTNALGKEDSYFETPSCAFDGIQKIYIYGSVELDTYIGSDGDLLDAIILRDDLVSTKEGVKVGDTPERVVEVYGSNYTDNNGSYTYEKDNMKLNFIIEDGAVVSIQYKSNAVG